MLIVELWCPDFLVNATMQKKKKKHEKKWVGVRVKVSCESGATAETWPLVADGYTPWICVPLLLAVSPIHMQMNPGINLTHAPSVQSVGALLAAGISRPSVCVNEL